MWQVWGAPEIWPLLPGMKLLGILVYAFCCQAHLPFTTGTKYTAFGVFIGPSSAFFLLLGCWDSLWSRPYECGPTSLGVFRLLVHLRCGLRPRRKCGPCAPRCVVPWGPKWHKWRPPYEDQALRGSWSEAEGGGCSRSPSDFASHRK
ncbi:hypothetical protein NDU88_000477 [Pleurodeles waltl]|uniref:Uncharacterized protein n=1 Tax=Pleurodeles waltl TaxID=8319 RepID=A0AAV7TFP1_PLEWA|nr:hypothetical protein NDU88_000477 [Pleurodeles waltl]